jgi:predicted DNA-binding ArsR family transcriptional regulator
MPEPSLALLQTLIERLIVEQRQVVDRLERVERALLAGQRLLLDRTETDTDNQHALDAITRRVEALEAG